MKIMTDESGTAEKEMIVLYFKKQPQQFLEE